MINIIIVSKAFDENVINTINSIKKQKFTNWQLIIKLKELQNEGEIKINNDLEKCQIIVKQDFGIYEAMNQAIDGVSTGFLLFLNAGDIFNAPDSLGVAIKLIEMSELERPEIKIHYFNWIRSGYGKSETVTPVIKPLKFNHQAVIYKSELHTKFGNYINLNNMLISDYLFFKNLQSNKVHSKIHNHTLSVINIEEGQSGKSIQFAQKLAIDFLCGEIGRIYFCIVVILHPIYHSFKKIKASCTN